MQNPYLPEEISFQELQNSNLTINRDTRCAICKGAKLLCGKNSCPILLKFYFYTRTKELIDNFFIDGYSPPSVFIGRFGYPYVNIGPLIPPIKEDTSLMDTPELWIGKSIEDIVNFRTQLVRGKYRVKISNVENSGRIVDLTRELALANNSEEVNAEFLKKPSGRLILDDEVQPFGPSAPLKKLNVGNLKIDQRIEKAYSDTDLLSRDAILNLYENGIFVSKIQRAFSVGAFGLKKRRKFVPTRWSITAVDSTISLNLIEKTKEFPLINEFRIYYANALDNRWIILFLPSSWRYELIEGWYPKTVWNPYGKDVAIFSSYEFYEGRKSYAEIGGCYYASRLAVNELLNKERRQAGVVVLREAHPGYIMPVGVWNVRENVRNALKQNCFKFNSLNECFEFIKTKMDIPLKRWINTSVILKDYLEQRRIEEF